MGQSNLRYKASMALIVICRGNTAGFLRNIQRGRGYFRRTPKTTKKIPVGKWGWHTSKDMWIDALKKDQSYEVRIERSDQRNNTSRDAAALKEATAARHAVKVEGILALVEEANVTLEDLSVPMDMYKLNVDYLEALILYKGQIPEKVPYAVQVDQLKKLLDADPFNPFSSHVQMIYYNK